MATSSSHPVGFRFHPTEEELVNHYLKNKIKGQDFDDVIPEVDICSCEPCDLPGLSSIRSDDDEWYYFSRPDYKTKGNSRNRATTRGFWKITGVEREIRARRGTKALVGKKRTLTFYIGKVRSGQKTGWVIHEYYIPEALFPSAARQRDFVLCRLKKKDAGTENGACDEGEGEVCQTSGNNAYDFQNLMVNFSRPSIQEEITQGEILATLFSPGESPHSPDYFATVLRDGILLANGGKDDHVVRQSAFGREDSEEGHYTLEDRPRTTLFNHSHEPTSMLHKVYDDEGINRQGLSIQDTNALRLYHFLKKNASFVDVAPNSPSDKGRFESVDEEESEYKRKKLPQVAFISLLKGEELQSGSQLPLRQDDYLTQSKTRSPTANSSKGPIKQGFQPQEVKYTSKVPEKSMEPQKPRRNDEQQTSMKQKQGDTTSSCIVWKESSLSLELCPPVIYIRNIIGGLVLSMFFVGELISYGKW